MTLVWLVVLCGALWMLTKGADFVLEGTETLGGRLGLTSFGAGAIIIGSLTSLPDLTAALVAQLNGAGDVVTGTAVGANIADIFLIAAIIAVLARGVRVIKKDLTFDIAWLAAATLALVFVMADGVVHMRESFVLVMMFALYAFATYAVTRERESKPHENTKATSLREVFLLLVGFALLIAGAHGAVESTLRLADNLHIATGVIGLFAIALGTTLPEFFVTLRAVKNKQASMALGNVFGSNIFNALVVVGIPGLLGAVHVDRVTHTYGMWAMIIATVVFIVTLRTRGGLSRTEGLIYLAAYAGFTMLVAQTIA